MFSHEARPPFFSFVSLETLDRHMSIKMAYNPLSFYLTVNGWQPELAPPLPEILKTVKLSGYDAIHSEVPAGCTPEAYLKLLGEHGLTPAPGYFQAKFAEAEGLAEVTENAVRVAADHAKLGLDRIFIAEQMGAEPDRVSHPAQGVKGDPELLKRIAEGLNKVSAAMAKEGIIPCLHAHVGTRIETAPETEFVLDNTDAATLLLGPDTGHLSWAGANLTEFLSRHAERVGAVHIKDYRRQVADQVKADGRDYRAAGADHIWTEPGRGSIDLDAALDALRGFDGWYIVEVDVADQPTVAESARLAADWLRPRLEARGK